MNRITRVRLRLRAYLRAWPKSLLQAVAVAAAISTLILGTPTPANAFAIEWHQWQHDEYGNGCGPGYFPWRGCTIGVQLTGNITTRAGWQVTAINASDYWYMYDSSMSRLDFQYDVGSSHDQVTVDATDLGGYNSQGRILLGYTNYYWDGTGQLTFASIQINTNAAANWCVDNIGQQCGTSNQFLRHSVGHELGHALGLNHPVQGPYSVLMECTQWTGEYSNVQTDDRNGENFLYSGTSHAQPGSVPC